METQGTVGTDVKTADDIGGFVAADDPLRPTVCPRCDYSLVGLPAEGVCPECGRGYGLPEVCLYGYAVPAAARTPRKAVRRSGVRRNLAWVWGISLLSLMVQVLILRRAPVPLPLRAWMFGCVLFAPALVTRRVMADRGSGVAQVRLGPDGVRQGTRGLGAIPFERADHAPLAPWRLVGRAVVRPAGDGQVRITLSSSARWWQWRRDYVSAVVWCPAEAAGALREQIAGWRARANDPAVQT